MKNRLSVLIPFGVVFCIGVAIAYQMIKDDRVLPIYAPSNINPDLVDESVRNVTSNHRIGDFKMIDENGEKFSSDELEGYIYVTDFFFTTCPTICPNMSENMQKVQKAFINKDDFRIVSFTVQPEIDSASVLKEYAELYEAEPKKWTFLTGDKRDIYDLARKTYFTSVTEGDGGPNDFIHTENFVLIDKEKRIRGFYDGTSSESIDQLITDVEILSQEYE